MAAGLAWLGLLSVWLGLFAQCDSLSPAIPAVLSTIGRIIRHYESNYEEMNLDGLFGLRVLEGQLAILTKEHERGELQNIPVDAMETVKHYQLIASKVSHLGIAAVRKDDDEYYEKLAYVVDLPWTFQSTPQKLDTSLRWTGNVYKRSIHSGLSESKSDQCMGELTGNTKQKTKGCQISAECIRIMTKKGLTQYGITHQLLWTMLGEKAGCTKELETKLAKTEYQSLDRLRTELCTNNYFEMKTLIEDYLNGTIIPKYQDLFLEIQFVCPNLGFSEFLKMDYLKDILRWQKEAGCYGKMPKVKNHVFINAAKFLAAKKIFSNDYDYEDEEDVREQKERGHRVMQMEQNPDLNSLGKIINHKPNAVQNDLNQKIRNSQEVFKANQNRVDGSRKLQEVVEETLVDVPEDFRVGRRLLVEKELSGGCLSHKTAVAAGALVMYLRYLMHGHPGLGEGNLELLEPGRNRGILQQWKDFQEAPENIDKRDEDVDKIDTDQKEEEDAYGVDESEEDYGKNNDNGKGAEKPSLNLVHFNGGHQNRDPDHVEGYKGDNRGDDGEYPYYDENEEESKSANKKHIREVNSKSKVGNPEDVQSQNQKSSKGPKSSDKMPTERTMIFVFLACFIIIVLFMYRFIKKRRIHIRYHTKALFGV